MSPNSSSPDTAKAERGSVGADEHTATSQADRPFPSETVAASLLQVQSSLRRLDRQEWWRWGVVIFVMLLLAGTVMILSLAAVFGQESLAGEISDGQAARGLLAVIVLFSLYLIYHQRLIQKTRTDLAGALAMLDSLTGLYSRGFAEQQLYIEMDRSQRHGYPLTVVVLDIKDFRGINEQYGRNVGDLVLKTFASDLKKRIRSCDLPARLGGDQFLLVLMECYPDAVPRVLARLNGPEVGLDGQRIPVTFTAGWDAYRRGEYPAQLLERAAQRLEVNKRSGKVEEQIRQEQAQIQQAVKMEAVGRLSGGIAHDFNNILNVILGYSDLLLNDLELDDPRRKRVKHIQEAGWRAASLTRQLLAFSRQQVLTPELLDMDAVVSGMSGILEPLVGEDIDLQVIPSTPKGWVKADRGQIEQVILNLAANARDAMPRGGKLTIETRNVVLDEEFVQAHPGSRMGPHVLLSVTDTGIGIKPDIQKHIFEPFFTTKEEGRGTGLGLSTVYGIVKQSGGYVSVDSSLGQGTTFSVYVPRVEEGPATGEQRRPAAEVPKGWETVLLVEDEEPVRKVAREFLERNGYRVLEATTGPEALRIADEHIGTIHLLMSDVVMPGMSGSELAGRLSAKNPKIKILHMSGYTDSPEIRRGLLHGTAAFLQKPFTQDSLLQKVRAVLDQPDLAPE